MRFFVVFSLAVLTQWCSALAHHTNGTMSPAQLVSIPTPPNDPFYMPPSGWRDAKPGDILRSRKVSTALLQIDKQNIQAAYQLLFRTTGTYESEPLTSVTTVVIPHNPKRNKLVNYNTYIDAVGEKCVPSYTFREGGEFGTDLAATYQQLFISVLMNRGYIVNTPDYQGPNRGFAVGPMEGRISIDSVRAALNFERVGLAKNTKVVSHGFSGGAICSGWVAAQHATYAPEINFGGFSMGGTPTNVTGTLQYLDGGFFSGVVVTGIAGLMYSYPKLLPIISRRLTSMGRDAIEFTRSQCFLTVILRYPMQRILSSNQYVEDGMDAINDPTVHDVVKDLVMGKDKKLTPKAPVYIWHGEHDEAIPYKDAATTAHAWADHGADVHLERYTDLNIGHITSELLNLPGVVRFVEARMADNSFPKGLTIETIGMPLDKPGAVGEDINEAMGAIWDILGREIGMGDSLLMSRITQHTSKKDLERARMDGKVPEGHKSPKGHKAASH